jgi:hypothetical protein
VAKNVDPGELWSAELVRRIGAAMKAARGSRSAQWLSERTAKLGYKVSPTVIAKLDSGHRGSVLSVAELLVLAAALDIAPTALMYPALTKISDGDKDVFVPGAYEQETELLPGVNWTEIEAAEWFSGNLDSPNPVVDTNFYQYRQNMKRLRDARLLRSLEERRRYLLTELRDLGDSDDDRVNFRRWSDELSRLESDIERHRAEGEPE